MKKKKLKKFNQKPWIYPKKKPQIRRKIMEGIKQIEKENRENDKKIVELQK